MPKQTSDCPIINSRPDDSDEDFDLITSVVSRFRKDKEKVEHQKRLESIKLMALKRGEERKGEEPDELEIQSQSPASSWMVPDKSMVRSNQKRLMWLPKTRPNTKAHLLEFHQKQARLSDLKRQADWSAKGGRTSIRTTNERIDMKAIIEKGSRIDDLTEADESDAEYDDDDDGASDETEGDERNGNVHTESISRGEQDTDKENIAPSPQLASPISPEICSSVLVGSDIKIGEELISINDENIPPEPTRSALLEAPIDLDERDENIQLRPGNQRKQRIVQDSDDEDLGPPLELDRVCTTEQVEGFDDLDFSQIFAENLV